VGMDRDLIIRCANYSEAVKLHSNNGFHKFSMNLVTDRVYGIRRDLVFLSRGRKSTLTRYLLGKLLWDNLSILEKDIMFTIPEFLKYPYYQILKSLIYTSKKVVRDRYNNIAPIFKLKTITRQQYLSIKGQFFSTFYEEEKRLPKTRKYSGYTKHHLDHGSIGEEKFYFSEEFAPVDYESILFTFLTVGEFPFGIPLPDDGPKSPKQ
jgi:hypothetical protein